MTTTTAFPVYAFALFFVLATACEPRNEQAVDSAASPPETPEPPRADTWTVDAQGIGRVRTGITVAALGEALGATITPVYDFNPSCTHVTPAGLPPGVSLMIVDDTVARIEVKAAEVRTTEGAGVGDTESAVVALYAGRVEVQPHKYTGPEGHYVVVTPPGDTLHRIIFETDGQKVLRYRAGRVPAVHYVEGCA
jgi:hypothetical protein